MTVETDSELLDQLHALSGSEFERFVAALWELQGWTTEVTDRIGDGGRDIVAHRTLPYEESIKIEAKGWTADRVSAPLVRAYALLPGEHFDQAVIVTSSEFTEPAKITARRHDVKLIARDALVQLVDMLDAEALLTADVEIDAWRAVRSEHYREWSLYPSWDGEPVHVIPEIGEKRTEQLGRVGIHTVSQLVSADADRVGEQLGLSRAQVDRWITLATCSIGAERTAVIDGVDSTVVEELGAVGIHTVDDLRAACAQDIASRSDLAEDDLKRWIGDAVRRDVAMVTAVSGIGHERAMTLARVGIVTVEELAGVDPAKVSEETGMDLGFVERRIEEAEKYLATDL